MNFVKPIITKELVKLVLNQYELPLDGIHGIDHWARVLENGLRLCALNQANKTVVQLFALFHDSKRKNEQRDDGHGIRGAEFARSLRGKNFNVTDEEFSLLSEACKRHTDGLTDSNLTVQTCWDADRLDLGRVNITIDHKYLCTSAAKQDNVLNWANDRAQRLHQPELIFNEWVDA